MSTSTSSTTSISSASTLKFAQKRTESTFDQIPIIDLGTRDDEGGKRKLADEILDAAVNVGFFYVVNHGIPESVIQDSIEAGKRFFALDTKTKMDYDIHKSSNFKGYTALLSENTDAENGKGDLHEGYDTCYEPLPGSHEESSEEELKDSKVSMKGENVWPDESVMKYEEFRGPLMRYYHAATGLGKLLFPLFALALQMDEHFFDDKTKESAAIMRVLHYPPQKASPVADDGSVIGIGAHTDYECFTLLWQDQVGGLQVQNKAGQWIDAVPIPGSIVVNLGDQFARWTNDVFQSTPHRAINKSGQERYSMPLFFGSDYDVLLEVIPTCVEDGAPPKYDVVKAGDYVKSRLEATYAASAA